MNEVILVKLEWCTCWLNWMRENVVSFKVGFVKSGLSIFSSFCVSLCVYVLNLAKRALSMEKQTKNKKDQLELEEAFLQTFAAFPQLQKYFKDCIKEVTNNKRYQYNWLTIARKIKGLNLIKKIKINWKYQNPRFLQSLDRLWRCDWEQSFIY